MTDKEKLIKLLKEFGVGFEDKGNQVLCQEGDEKVGGYTLFYTAFDFSDDGSFEQMGALE